VLHEGPLGSEPLHVDFSPDLQRGRDQLCDRSGILDVETGDWVRTPVDAHDLEARSLAYAPDSAILASGSADGRAGLWDDRSGALLGTVLPGRPNTPVTVEFLPDGHTLLISSADGAVYTTRPQGWVDHACEVAGHNLTHEEWRDAFADRRYHRTCSQQPVGK
jgi:WD40 repeat protein